MSKARRRWWAATLLACTAAAVYLTGADAAWIGVALLVDAELLGLGTAVWDDQGRPHYPR